MYFRLLTYTGACVNYFKYYLQWYKNVDRHRKYIVKGRTKREHTFIRTENKQSSLLSFSPWTKPLVLSCPLMLELVQNKGNIGQSHWTKIKAWEWVGCTHFRSLGQIVSLPFLAFRSCSHFLAYAPPHPPSSKPETSNLSLTRLYCCISWPWLKNFVWFELFCY